MPLALSTLKVDNCIVVLPGLSVVIVAIGSLLIVSNSGLTHGRGLYATEVEAQQRAEEIGCATTHQIKDRWMPCSDERELHQQLRKQ